VNVDVASGDSGKVILYLHGGSHEMLLNDSTRLATGAARGDVEVTLEVTPRVPRER
jgi:hypothetical protein